MAGRRRRGAFLVDGNNLSHDLIGDSMLYPVLGIALEEIADISRMGRYDVDIIIKWLYFDHLDPNPRDIECSKSLGFEEKSIGVPADPVIKRHIKDVCSRPDIDMVFLGSGDGGFEPDIDYVLKKGREPVVIGISGHINEILYKEGVRVIEITEKRILEFV